MDKNSVYYFRAKIQKTVPVSFLILKDGKAKEKNNFYLEKKRIIDSLFFMETNICQLTLVIN